MITVLDKEYLSRPLLDVEFRITDTEIYVSSNHTGYANMTKLNRILKEDILQLYKEVIKLAKARGVKLSYKNHYKRTINDNWGAYREELKYYSEVFDKAKSKFLEVEKRGIHQGTSDDIVLHEALSIRNEYLKCYWRSTKISQIHSIYSSLQKYHRDLQYPDCNYYMLYL